LVHKIINFSPGTNALLNKFQEMLVSESQNLGRKLSIAAFNLVIVGFPLWLLSYVWIPFRIAGRETETVWNIVVASEIGAMAAGLISIALGLIARQYIKKDNADFRRATWSIKLSASLWICIVLFNLLGIFFFS
jgi:hypothetical protein